MAQQYSIEVGSAEFLSLDPPAGYVRSANWNCDEGLKLTSKSEAGAVVEVSHWFSGAAYVNCSYVYEYLGSYDNRYHAGTGSKTYRIICIEGKATISETVVTLSPGEKHTLKCVQSRSYGKPTWESSDEDVVTVDAKGKLVAVGSGHARITLDPIISAPLFCDVTVRKIDAKTVTLTPNPMNVVVGKSKKMSPIYTPSGASASLTWISDNESVATVSSSGLVTGVNVGIANITVQTENKLIAKAKVNVVSAPSSVALPYTIRISAGFYYTLLPTLTPLESEATYKWKSSDTSVATVSSQGKVYGKKEGSSIITVTTDNGKEAKCTVNIESAPQDMESATKNYRIKTITDLIKELSK